MTSNPTKIVLIDTNCFIRLYPSPVLPLLGQQVGEYKLLTLDCLVDEFLNNPTLTGRYPLIAQDPRRNNLVNSKLNLRKPNRDRVQNYVNDLRPYAKSFLEFECKRRGVSPAKSLARADLELIATTLTLGGVMATDEWPLRLVAEDLMQEPDDYKLGLFSSIQLLHLLESHGRLTADQRRETVDLWIRADEKLLRGWQKDYEQLFEESPDLLGR